MSSGICGHSPYILKRLKEEGELLGQPLENYWVYSSYRPWLTGNIRWSLDCKEAVAINYTDIKETGGNCIIAVPNPLSREKVKHAEITFLSFPEIPFLTFAELWQDNLEHKRDSPVGLACESGGCPLALLHQRLRPVPGYTWNFNSTRASLGEQRLDNKIVRRSGEIPGFLSFIVSLVDEKPMGIPITYHEWEEILLLVAASYKFEIPLPVVEHPGPDTKYIRTCGDCGRLYYWSAEDIAERLVNPTLPCGHDWKPLQGI